MTSAANKEAKLALIALKHGVDSLVPPKQAEHDKAVQERCIALRRELAKLLVDDSGQKRTALGMVVTYNEMYREWYKDIIAVLRYDAMQGVEFHRGFVVTMITKPWLIVGSFLRPFKTYRALFPAADGSTSDDSSHQKRVLASSLPFVIFRLRPIHEDPQWTNSARFTAKMNQIYAECHRLWKSTSTFNRWLFANEIMIFRDRMIHQPQLAAEDWPLAKLKANLTAELPERTAPDIDGSYPPARGRGGSDPQDEQSQHYGDLAHHALFEPHRPWSNHDDVENFSATFPTCSTRSQSVNFSLVSVTASHRATSPAAPRMPGRRRTAPSRSRLHPFPTDFRHRKLEEAVERIADHLSYLPRAYQDALKRLLFDTTPRSRNRLSERGQHFAKNAMYLSWFDTVASLLMIRAQSGETFDPDLFELYATAPWAIDAPRLDSERTFPTGAIVFDEYVDTRVLASSLPFSIFRLCLSLRSPGLSARDIQPPQAFVDRMDELYEAMRGPWNASVSAQRFKFSQEIKSIAEDFAANPLKSTDKNNWRFKKLRRALSRPEDLRPTEADGDPELYPPVKHHAVRRYSEIDLSERALHDLRAELRRHRSESPSHTGHHDPKSLGHQASLSQRRHRLLPSIEHRMAPRYFPGRTKEDWEAAHRSFA